MEQATQTMNYEEVRILDINPVADIHSSSGAHLEPDANTMPFSPLRNPLSTALVTQYCFLPRVTHLVILSLENLSLRCLGMKGHCLQI